MGRKLILIMPLVLNVLIYSQDNLDDEYKTTEFADRVDGWVKELILNLIQIRKEYLQQWRYYDELLL